MKFEIISVCKGGGYLYCKTFPSHPRRNSNGLYPLHRVLMENKLGRLLKRTEDVHHINGDRFDNSVNNLEVLSRSEHAKKHKPIQPSLKITCPTCEKTFKARPSQYRARVKRNKSGKIFCSASCGTIYSFNAG